MITTFINSENKTIHYIFINENCHNFVNSLLQFPTIKNLEYNVFNKLLLNFDKSNIIEYNKTALKLFYILLNNTLLYNSRDSDFNNFNKNILSVELLKNSGMLNELLNMDIKNLTHYNFIIVE